MHGVATCRFRVCDQTEAAIGAFNEIWCAMGSASKRRSQRPFQTILLQDQATSMTHTSNAFMNGRKQQTENKTNARNKNHLSLNMRIVDQIQARRILEFKRRTEKSCTDG